MSNRTAHIFVGILFLSLVFLVTGFGQNSSVVYEEKFAQSETQMFGVSDRFVSIVDSAKKNNGRLVIIGTATDTGFVGFGPNMSAILNSATAIARASYLHAYAVRSGADAVLVSMRDQKEAKVVVEWQEENRVNLDSRIIYLADSIASAKMRAQHEKDSIATAQKAEAKRIKDSTDNANKPPFLQVGLGYSLVGRDGSVVPHGPTISLKFFLGKVLGRMVKLEARYFALTTYEDGTGHNGFLIPSVSVLGDHRNGLDLAIGVGVSSFLLKDGRDKWAPDRSILLTHLMSGTQFRGEIGPVCLEGTLLVGYSPRFGWTKDGIFTMDSKFGTLLGVNVLF